MRDAIAMWRSTKMVVLVALTAAVYAAVLIPFKPIPIIPGITEIRPAAAIPIVCGLLFGPAAAWGSAIGKLISEFTYHVCIDRDAVHFIRHAHAS